MNYPDFYIEFMTKSHQEEMLRMAAEARLSRQAPSRRPRRSWRWRLRGGVIAFGLRRHARRQRLARRRYVADWRAEVRAIVGSDDET